MVSCNRLLSIINNMAKPSDFFPNQFIISSFKRYPNKKDAKWVQGL